VRILVTNDDGIDSEGLAVLSASMQRHGEVVVVAPDTEYSGASAALGALQRMRTEVHRAAIGGVAEAWAVTGPPALCVTLARLGAFGEPFDLVVAGINPGANVGRSVYHSGTVGAALTARTAGMSGVAVSQAVVDFGVEGQGWDEMLEDQCWHSASAVADAVVGALVGALPADPVVLNVNVPNRDLSDIRAVRLTRVGTLPPRALDHVDLIPKQGHPGSYRVELRWGRPVSLPPDTDGGAIERDEVSLTFLGPVAEVRPGGVADLPGTVAELLGVGFGDRGAGG
jgi:5'-nucleotidase